MADHFSRLLPFPTKNVEEAIIPKDNTTTFLMGVIGEAFRIPDAAYARISKVHNSTSGHRGVQATLRRLTTDEQGEVDALLRGYVKKYVRECPCCQKMRQIRAPILTQRFTTATYDVIERIAIDAIGPLPEDEDGNMYILVIIDCFSRFVQLYPVKNTTAAVAVKALIRFVGTFGCPAQVLTDNGTQFVNELVKGCVRILGTEHVRTMPYSKEENGMVERANKEVMRHMRAIIFDKKIVHQWGYLYPLVERIMNAEVHESIGVSPSQILFGNAINLDRGIFVPFKPEMNKTVALSEWTSNMLQAQADVVWIAQHTQRKKDDAHIGTQGAVTEFPINSYVLVQYETKDHKPPTKLHMQLKGPMRVVNFNGSRYTVQNLVTNALEDFHVTNLRVFRYDPSRVDPREVANADQQATDVEMVLAHKGSIKSKKSLKFKVRWAGEGPQGDTWEPWATLRTNKFLFEYLVRRNLHSWIPVQYRSQF